MRIRIYSTFFRGCGGLVLSSFYLIIIVRISECFANCLIFSLKVVYFSNTIHFISEGSANNLCEFVEMDQKRWVTVPGLFSWYWNDFHSGMSPVHIIFCSQDTEQHFIPVQVIPGWAHSSFQWPVSNEIIVLVQRRVIQAHVWELLCNRNIIRVRMGI